jgi:hypothetical protein
MFKNYRVRVLGGKQWGTVGIVDLEEPTLIEKVKQLTNKN